MNPFKKNREKKETEADLSYEMLFMTDPGIRARDGKMLYIHSDFHEAIRAYAKSWETIK